MYNAIIVCGLIEHDNKVLIGKKIECDHPVGLGGKWHIPGGMVENNETLKEALKREIKEETKLEIQIKEPFGYKIIPYNKNKKAKIMCFRCAPKNHKYKASDDLQELKWVKKQDVLKILDKDIIKILCSKELIAYLKKS